MAQGDPIEQTVSRLFNYKKKERSASSSPTPPYEEAKSFAKAKMMPIGGQRFMPIPTLYKELGYNAPAFKVP